VKRTLEEARRHVVAESHAVQFELLQMEGMISSSRVVEYGCGMLDLARHLVPYLLPGHYVGVEPNAWVPETVLEEDPEFAAAFRDRDGTLIHRHDFVAPGPCDFVFAHSVLSHAADHQLTEFLEQSAQMLEPGGKIIASIRLGPDTRATDWVYPGVTWFSLDTVTERAARFDFDVVEMRSYKDRVMASHPDECHDWLVFT
jgi:SAM-dependent methyltransferase